MTFARLSILIVRIGDLAATEMTKSQAKTWLKQNWNQLAFSGKLGEAVTRYLSLKDSPPIIEEEKTAVVEVVSPANDKKIADFFGSPLD